MADENKLASVLAEAHYAFDGLCIIFGLDEDDCGPELCGHEACEECGCLIRKRDIARNALVSSGLSSYILTE